jgi:acyl-CoA thioester hydrolase
MHALLNGFAVVLEMPVLWGDQDAFGHVNNTVYLRWAETARIEYLARAGLWVPAPPDGIGPILAGISCDYRAPLTFPDNVSTGARVTSIGNSSLRLEHRIVSASLDAVAAELESTLVLFDYRTKKPVRVPDEMRRAIEGIEGRAIESTRASEPAKASTPQP